MTTGSELEHLLSVEEIHTSHFEEWSRRATHPLAKVAFRLAADKEANHTQWVRLLIEIAKAKDRGEDLGVTRGELEFWIEDESGEGESYEDLARRANEPWVRAVLGQIAKDQATNAELLRDVLRATP